jgi:CheY-like chemotaxis protein
MNYAAVARAAPTNEPRVVEAAERITQAVDQATGLTRSLLTFSRRATTDKAPIHLGQAVSATVDLLKRMLPAAIEIAADLPTSAPGLWIKADATQLQQVVMNLAVNARDAMPDGGRLHIAVVHRAVDSSDVLAAVATRGMGAAVLIIEDTGAGMSDDVRARLFEPFFTTKARERGTGLGMAIVHGIVTDHQGTIDVESRVNEGTRIEVAFPCCAPGDPAERTTSETPRHRGRGQTVLLAEDNEVVRSLLASSLRSLNYKVLECKHGAEALDVFERRHNDISAVILDVDLPKKSGTACLKQMRAASPELPAVVITGSVGPRIEDLRDAQTRALYKPFLVIDLAKQLSDVLNASDRRAAQP